MLKQFLSYFEYNNITPPIYQKNHLIFQDYKIPVINDIPRFTPNRSYSDSSFYKLRQNHSRLQLDSVNKTNDRRETILSRTNWNEMFFKNKLVLECGCGAGPDTEILLSLGAKVVAIDHTGIDIAAKNLGPREKLCLIQGDITKIPLQKQSFDIVFCHRVIQHTPNPLQTLNHILKFVKQDGAVFVHSYARTFFQMCTWKYALRPITTRMQPEKLYGMIKNYSSLAYHLTNLIASIPKGAHINNFFIPFRNYKKMKAFQGKSDEWLIEYGIHDTFDALSPRYDRPLSANEMYTEAINSLHSPFEIIETKGLTLLRTL